LSQSIDQNSFNPIEIIGEYDAEDEDIYGIY